MIHSTRQLRVQHDLESDHLEARLQAAYAHLAALIKQHKAVDADIAKARQDVQRLEHQAFGLGPR